ncbi:O-antigen ligase domain-containing protein [Mesobaculum littorinae]|uniref:O-antigen ligase domain-containing protein n=1 Tax=Mesobaculum littorinae TaxID=2486419 RepID=A0A438AIA0_9RHOB|nr:O-antigen ligase family protein [Mesobaculum littorinae]RVV98466.1 O-antigen ligase domain-containing protein [Mesobaculum littorinae]
MRRRPFGRHGTAAGGGSDGPGSDGPGSRGGADGRGTDKGGTDGYDAQAAAAPRRVGGRVPGAGPADHRFGTVIAVGLTGDGRPHRSGAGTLLGALGLAGLAATGQTAILLALGLAAGAGLLAVLIAAPGAGALALIAMAQLDGVVEIANRASPVSLFKLLSAATLAALALLLARTKARTGRPAPSGPVVLSLFFALWVALTHFLSPMGAAGREQTIDLLSTLLLVPIIALSLGTARDLDRAVLILAASGAISALLVLLEAKGGIRLTPVIDAQDIADWRGEIRSSGGSAENPTTAAQLIAVSFMVAVVMALRDPARRWLWAALAGLCLMGLPLMGARSAILATGTGLALLAWRYRRHPRFPLAMAACVAGGLALLPFVPASLWERFDVLGDLFDGGNTSDRTLLRRISYNLIGLDLLSQNPVFGTGPGGFPQHYAGADYRWYPGRELMPRRLHNAYLEVAAETGLVGLGLFLGALGGAVTMALRAARGMGAAAARASALGHALVVFLVASLFMPNEDIKYLWILVALCAKAAWLARKDPA